MNKFMQHLKLFNELHLTLLQDIIQHTIVKLKLSSLS